MFALRNGIQKVSSPAARRLATTVTPKNKIVPVSGIFRYASICSLTLTVTNKPYLISLSK